MTLIDYLMLSLALAMDCFAVSIVCGIILPKKSWSIFLRIAILFGIFQAAMPFIGWFCTTFFYSLIEKVDHWIAFALLVVMGSKMIRDSFCQGETPSINPHRLTTQITLAIATSIDALAIGVTFTCTGLNNIQHLVTPIAIIGLGSFIMSIIGSLIGIKYGKVCSSKIKPELLGGIVLIGIGIKVLLSHLFNL